MTYLFSLGSQMILSMKVISVAFDLQNGALQELPSFWEYCGYVFHIGSVIFGPWLGFSEYIADPQHRRDRKLVGIFPAEFPFVFM